MCGIVFISNSEFHDTDSTFMNTRHRGPDKSRQLFLGDTFIGFHRLSINDTSDNGMQPFKDFDGNYLICNGEIYNYKSFDIKTNSGSDCEILLPLYKEMNPVDFLNSLDGDFAFVIKGRDNSVFAARDPIHQ